MSRAVGFQTIFCSHDQKILSGNNNVTTESASVKVSCGTVGERDQWYVFKQAEVLSKKPRTLKEHEENKQTLIHYYLEQMFRTKLF